MSIALHYNEMAEYAVRKFEDVIPGRLYAMVHTRPVGDTEHSPPSIDYVWVTGTDIRDWNKHQKNMYTYWYVRDSLRVNGWYSGPVMGSATDQGVWEVGNYRNTMNYLLDVEDLRDHGIEIINQVSVGTDKSWNVTIIDYGF